MSICGMSLHIPRRLIHQIDSSPSGLNREYTDKRPLKYYVCHEPEPEAEPEVEPETEVEPEPAQEQGLACKTWLMQNIA